MLKRTRFLMLFVLAAIMSLGSVVSAHAVGVANTAVTGAFTTMADDIVATIGPIAIAAVGIAVVFLCFRYGRKILTSIAK